MTSIITPKILKGTRDFLPQEMAKRRYVMEKIRSVFVNFGYDTIETPAIEYAETLLGKYGEEGNKLTYSFEDNGGRKIALRYDQTVPFARLVAANSSDLPMPFKRYQIDKVWRADKPAKGRYREFVQCDIDIWQF
ncbi:MAG: Histidine-tRNA ligase [Candidatus Peregrinibacteria bacterium GW2011_GWA2_47_7]|nr:MAG: Histidine-tRNA ligase [Candidatus Peregrinibacteria bacterium GW2011_GWA2_47_7]